MVKVCPSRVTTAVLVLLPVPSCGKEKSGIFFVPGFMNGFAPVEAEVLALPARPIGGREVGGRELVVRGPVAFGLVLGRRPLASRGGGFL